MCEHKLQKTLYENWEYQSSDIALAVLAASHDVLRPIMHTWNI